MKIIKNLKLKINNGIIFTVLALLIILSISGCSFKKQLAITSQQTNIVKQPMKEYAVLQIDFGDDKIITNYQLLITNKENGYLWSAMKEALSKNQVYLDYQDYGGDLGVFIKQIGDKKNGEDGKYWQYFVNGEYAKVGASNYKVQARDIILWKFTNQLSIY